MKTITKISASIVIALGLGLGSSAYARSGGGHGGGHSGGGHSGRSGGSHGGGHSGGGHSGGAHHGGAHGHHHSGIAGSGLYLLPRYGSAHYGTRSAPYGRSQPAGHCATCALLAEVQSALARRGYYRGTIDSIIGSSSRRALRAFQRDSGLPVSGGIDRATLNRLGLG